MYGFIGGWALMDRVGGGRSLGASCAALRRGKEGEKRWNEVGDEEFVTCCDSLNLINTL